MLVWCEDDPGIVDLTKVALNGHLTKLKLSEMKEKNLDVPENELQEMNKIVTDGEEAKKVVEEFYDTYITCMNPLGEGEEFEKPDLHPCAQDYTEMKDDTSKKRLDQSCEFLYVSPMSSGVLSKIKTRGGQQENFLQI